MSKVIKTPQGHNAAVDWVKQEECPMCHALIEYTNFDVYHKYDDKEIHSQVQCPWCHDEFEIEYPGIDKV